MDELTLTELESSECRPCQWCRQYECEYDCINYELPLTGTDN